MNVYDFSVKTVDGKEESLSKYKGKVLLIINSATHCGLTPQYKGLENLYQTYKDDGFEILDFPCNQFANQAPESDEEIGKICELNYQTTFKRYAKIKVNGNEADPLYKYLKNNAPKEEGQHQRKQGWFSSLIFGRKIKWNFTKFLIDKNGQIVRRFSPSLKPEQFSDEIKAYLS